MSTAHPVLPAIVHPQLDLPAQVMRRALAVAVVAMAVAAAVGLWRAKVDMGDEVGAAVAVARWVAALAGDLPRSDTAAIALLRHDLGDAPLRHLRLTIRGADGSVLATIVDDNGDASSVGRRVGEAAVKLHRRLFPMPPAPTVQWVLHRPGRPWTLAFEASPESERREALAYLGSLLAVFAAAMVAVLAVMAANVRRALRPLRQMLAAITQIERGELAAVRDLAAMPVGELEAIAAALRHLGAALAAAQEQRQVLSRRMLSLQEDERARLARELHDEFGQRLTAMRVDCAWLARQTASQPALREVVDGMAAQCGQVQHDIRSTLARLQPLSALLGLPHQGAGLPRDDSAMPSASESLARLVMVLRSLVNDWSRSGGSETAYRLQLDAVAADGKSSPWPVNDELIALPVELVLAVYRLSQEALTNAARHAGANRVELALTWQAAPRSRPGTGEVASAALVWSVGDDGVGLPDDGSSAQRGNGLAGMRERAWAMGGELLMSKAPVSRRRSGHPGHCLSARFQVTTVAEAAALPDRGGLVATTASGDADGATSLGRGSKR
jgi:two-component system sensor histidine kinase UhpB